MESDPGQVVLDKIFDSDHLFRGIGLDSKNKRRLGVGGPHKAQIEQTEIPQHNPDQQKNSKPLDPIPWMI